jgi:hypothetical protein
MIESYFVLAERIRKELDDLERLVVRANRAISTAKKNPQDADLFLDSASLNMHDVYSGFERVFKQIAATVDGSVPASSEWHRELLEQMALDLPKVRPPILSRESIRSLDEYLRFRHVVRNVYTFSFDPERISRLVKELEIVLSKLSRSYQHLRISLKR